MTKPKFTIIKQHICDNIESGLWPQHSKVPSENELAALFGVSRMTARRALQELTDQNVLERSQGAGTFVAAFKSQSSLMAIRNIADEISEHGHYYSAKQLKLVQVIANREVAGLLNIAPESPVYYSEILHCKNNEPIQLEQRFVNPELVPKYLQQNFAQITPHEYLSTEAPLTEAVNEVEAVLAKPAIGKLLNIADGQPCLQVKRRTWSSQGVVSFATLTSPGNKYRLGGHLVF